MWCPGEERGRGRCVTSEEVRLDRPASETGRLCGRPHASRGAALLELGGPLRGRGGRRGADCPWHPDPFRVRARYGVGWGCAERLRGFFCQEKTKECRENLIKAHARPKTNTT